ncbi:chromosomal replication initiator protein DnaA [Polyangium mundeleinium]|uniref:Chromosomal replication initiator protein DnaA n=1 Tax=Polyangium mundeleinium TaxID=2995306 RepID=A0ABT5F3T5_9BACT|nr:chromosomal replication initiator protein DnaA [Polyangium mundeleinium]MDC0748757.1 chromosomal replication initiator protein DnaA [Polyangium mundeleinium]
MTTSRDESRAIFERAIEHTRGLSPATFDQWFGGVQFDDLTDGVLSLRVQNEFVLEWVKTNFLPTITDKIRELTGWSVQVAWTIDQHLEAPIANVPQMPPVRPRSLVVRSSTNPPAAPASPSAPVAAEPRAPASAPTPLRRPALPDDLNPKHTFATFVVGPSNQLAHAAAIAAAGGGGRRYNPLFICGGTGLGKTHLVHAIAHRVLDERPGARIIYVSAERFTNDFITAIQHHRMDDFRAKYRVHCDLLLVDDIQFLAGREQTQEEFFHTFNALHGLDRQIVVTSDKYPQNLERMEERLVSRFSWGLVADIQAPELETRVAIVRNKAALEGIVLPDDVALYLAQVIRSNVRELEGTLIRLAAKSSLTGRPVDLAFARAEITAATPRAQIMSVEDIQRAVCHHFHLRSIDLTSKDRHKSIAFARHVAMYLCKQRLKVSFPEIGRAFGNRDHTTVMSAVRKIEAQRDTDPQVRAHLEALERKLAGDS